MNLSFFFYTDALSVFTGVLFSFEKGTVFFFWVDMNGLFFRYLQLAWV